MKTKISKKLSAKKPLAAKKSLKKAISAKKALSTKTQKMKKASSSSSINCSSSEMTDIQALLSDIQKGLKQYSAKEKIGFNELVRRLKISSAQVAKIQKGEANLRMLSVVRIGALLKKKARIVFK